MCLVFQIDSFDAGFEMMTIGCQERVPPLHVSAPLCRWSGAGRELSVGRVNGPLRVGEICATSESRLHSVDGKNHDGKENAVVMNTPTTLRSSETTDAFCWVHLSLIAPEAVKTSTSGTV